MLCNMKSLLKNRYVQNGLLVICSIIIAIVAIDLVSFYIVGIKYPGYGGKTFFQFSPLTGYFHVPNAEGYWYTYRDGTHYPVKINSFGFSDTSRTVEKTKPRIAMIGDSVVQCWEAEEDKRVHLQMEEMLDQRYEVLNFGVRGFGTDQTYILFKHVGVHFDPDIVVYTFCINDLYDNAQTYQKPYFVIDESQPHQLRLQGYPIELPKPPDAYSQPFLTRLNRTLVNHSLVYRKAGMFFTRYILNHFKDKKPAGPAVRLEDHWGLRPYKKEYNQEDEKRWQLMKALILRLNEFVSDEGKKFLFVQGLDKPQLSERRRQLMVQTYGDVFDFEKISKKLHALCIENDIPYLDMAKVVRTKNVSVDELMHPVDDNHFNNTGAVFYAECVVERIDSLGWINL